MSYYILMFGISLGATLLLELIVALCFGLRGRKQLILVILVNLLTNPAAVWLHSFWGIPQIPIELLVVIIEYYVYHSFRRERHISHPLLLSVAANGISWGTGLLLTLL